MDPKTLKGGKPVAWAAPGLSAGIGTEIGLACHRRFMADKPKARVGLPEILIGIFPGAGGTTRLVRMLGVDGRRAPPARGQDARPRRRQGRRPDRRGRRRPTTSSPPPRPGCWPPTDADIVKPWDAKGYKMPGGAPYHPAGFMTFVGASGHGPRQDPGRLPRRQGDAVGDLRGRARPLRHRAPDRGALVHPRPDEPLLLGDDPLALPQQAGAGEGRRPPRPARPERAEARHPRRRHDGRRHRHRRRAGRHRGRAHRPRPGRRRPGRAHVAGLPRRGREAQAHHPREEAPRSSPASPPPPTTPRSPAATWWSRRSSRTPPSRPRPPAAPRRTCRPEAIFATNTSTLPDRRARQGQPRRRRSFIGIHFFSPVEKMALVEIIRGPRDRRPRRRQGARLRPPDPQDPDRRQRRPLLLRQPLHHPLHQRGRAHGRRRRRAGADRERRQAARHAARPAAARRRDLDRPRREDRQGDQGRDGRRLSREPGRRRALRPRRPRPARAQGRRPASTPTTRQGQARRASGPGCASTGRRAPTSRRWSRCSTASR